MCVGAGIRQAAHALHIASSQIEMKNFLIDFFSVSVGFSRYNSSLFKNILFPQSVDDFFIPMSSHSVSICVY